MKKLLTTLIVIALFCMFGGAQAAPPAHHHHSTAPQPVKKQTSVVFNHPTPTRRVIPHTQVVTSHDGRLLYRWSRIAEQPRVVLKLRAVPIVDVDYPAAIEHARQHALDDLVTSWGQPLTGATPHEIGYAYCSDGPCPNYPNLFWPCPDCQHGQNGLCIDGGRLVQCVCTLCFWFNQWCWAPSGY